MISEVLATMIRGFWKSRRGIGEREGNDLYIFVGLWGEAEVQVGGCADEWLVRHHWR